MLRYTSNKIPIVNIAPGQIAQVVNLEFQRVQNVINTAGGHKVAARTITADDTVASTDGTVYGDTTASNVVATLPYANQYSGMLVGFKQVAGSNTYTVQVNPNAGGDQIIDATPSVQTSVVVTGVAIQLHSDGIATWNQV